MADEEGEDEKPAKGGDSEGGEGEGEGGGGGGRSFSPLKIILFVGLPVLLLVGLGATAYFMGWLSFFGGGGEEPVAAEHETTVATPAAFIDLPRFTVNLATTGNQRALLQLTMSIELANAAMKPQVEAVLPRVVDSFQVFLRDLRVEDLAGTRGTYRLKEEMLIRANAALAPIKVEDVLFREMLVQ